MSKKFYRCDTCGSENYSVVFKPTVKNSLDVSDFTVFGELGEYHQVVKCSICGLSYANPRDDSKSLEKKYTEMSVSEYLSAEESRRLIASKDANIVGKYCLKGDVLDIGCSAGLFLASLNSNFHKTGIEPSIAASNEAKKNVPDGHIFCSTLFDAPLDDSQFDVVTMWDVIEHMESPRKALVKVGVHLKSDGHLVLVTPNIGSFTARVMGRKWTHLIRGHIYYYSKSTIRQLLEKSGYKVVSISSYTRYFKVGYVLKRLGLFSPRSGWPDKFPLFRITIPINFGDSLLVVACKTQESNG